MELLFEVNPNLGGAEDYVVCKKRIKLAPQTRPVLSLSVRNLIAFSSSVDLTVGGEDEAGVSKIAGCHVYVADLNTPWEVNLVKNSPIQATLLQWDHTGSKLMVGMEDGTVQVFGMGSNLLNKWNVLYEAVFSGEPIMNAAWLSHPRRLVVDTDKLDGVLYSEKYSVSVPYSSKGFGGKGLEGLVLVTGTGLLGSIVASSMEDGKPIVCSEKMVAVRGHVQFADTAYCSDGDVMVVTSTGDSKQPILVNKVSVSLTSSRDKIDIKSSSKQSLFTNSVKDCCVTGLRFVNKICTDYLLISFSNQTTGESRVHLFELIVQPVSLKNRFQASSSPGNEINTYKWQQAAYVQFPSEITSWCPVPTPLINGLNCNLSSQMPIAAALTPVVAIALSNGSIVVCRCDNLQQVATVQCGSQNAPEDTKKVLSPSLNEAIISTEFSWSGSVLLALTANSHIQAFKVHSNLDPSAATTLLEAGMAAGLDSLDVLMCVKPSLVDSIADRLSENFARQPIPVQTACNAKVLVVKTALYRLGSSGTARINDQQTLLILHLVSGALKALLRPSELSSKEKGPVESLSSLLGSSGEQYADLTKVLVQMTATEYAVEAPTLQSIQQFLQWCADLALKLLSTLPDLRHSRAPGWEVCRDSKAVATLRELIVLMRIWGLLRPSCLPAFRKTSDGLDVLPLLFRLLTKLSVAPHDPDESLIDECCLLPSEVQIPNHTAYCPTKSLGLASNIIFSRGSPFQFQFGTLPLKWWVGVETSGNWMDGIRLLWLGKNPAGVKICNRCGCTTLISIPPRSTANKAWDQRWLKSCPCGGYWKIPSFLPQPKAQDADFLNHL